MYKNPRARGMHISPLILYNAKLHMPYWGESWYCRYMNHVTGLDTFDLKFPFRISHRNRGSCISVPSGNTIHYWSIHHSYPCLCCPLEDRCYSGWHSWSSGCHIWIWDIKPGHIGFPHHLSYNTSKDFLLVNVSHIHCPQPLLDPHIVDVLFPPHYGALWIEEWR